MRDGAVLLLKKLYDLLQEKRKYSRVYVLVPLEIVTDSAAKNKINGIIHNLSSGGLGILLDRVLAVNTIVQLKFELRGACKLENVQAGVVRCNKIGTKYDVGLLFMNLGQNQARVDDYLNNLKKKKYESTVDVSRYVV